MALKSALIIEPGRCFFWRPWAEREVNIPSPMQHTRLTVINTNKQFLHRTAPPEMSPALSLESVHNYYIVSQFNSIRAVHTVSRPRGTAVSQI